MIPGVRTPIELMIKRLLLAIVILDIPFHLDISLGHDEYFSGLNAITGFELSLMTFCLVALYLLWLVEAVANKFATKQRLCPLGWPPLLYVIVAGTSFGIATNKSLAAYELWLLLQIFLLFVYVVKHMRSEKDILFVVRIMIFGLFMQSLVMLGLSLVGESITIGPYVGRVDGDHMGRIGGTVGSPNTASGYISVLLASCLALIITAPNRWQLVAASITLIFATIALTLTLSRGGWAAAAVSLGFFCTFAWWRGWLATKIPLLISVSALIIVAIFHQSFIERLFGDDGGAAQSRIPLMYLALDIAADHPFLGVGANNFAAVMDPYVTYPDYSGVWVHVVHNKYLLVLAETGIVGLITYLLFLLVAIRQGLRVAMLDIRQASPLALGLTAGLLGQMLHMSVDLFHSRSLVEQQWLCIALILALNHLLLGKQQPDTECSHSASVLRHTTRVSADDNLSPFGKQS